MLRYLFILISPYLVNCNNLTYPCKTPNQENANCISLFACPVLSKSLCSLEPNAVAFVKDSICLGREAREFMVCCGTAGNYLQKPSSQPVVQNTTSVKQPIVNSTEARREYVKTELLPSRKYCGYQQTDDRFYNSTETALDEFPWLVHIKNTEMELESIDHDMCHGVIISDRYVLTDAYCGFDAKIIKIGQYSTNLNVSCISDPNFEECIDSTIYVKIEETIRSGKKENGPYDFTLLRLATRITYSDYIRPICLPTEGSLRPASQPTLALTGWGTAVGGTILKKRLYYNLTEEETCYVVGNGLEGNVKFANVSLACLIPNNNTDVACYADHGGPLMYSYRHQWFVEAIVVEAFACSNKGPITGIFITPGFMEWILDSIKD